jgi:rubrerythrin
VQQNSGVVSRKVLQRDVDETKALPPNAFFKPKSMLWEQLSNQIKIISQGGSGMLPSVSNEFSLSMDNTNKFIEHAQSSHVYYVGKTPNKSQGGIVEDAKEFLGKALNGDTNGIKAKYCEADLNWGGNFLQELNVGNQNSSSWLNSVNSALDSYNDLVKKCKALNIEVYNAAPTGLQKAFNPNAIGEQKINTSDISGYGNTLYTLAKKGDAPMPDPTTYNNSIEEYNNARNSLSPKTRAITSLFIKVQKDTIDSKLKAKEEDKEKWEAYKKMVDAFATGISLAVGGELEGSSPAGVTMDSVTGDAQMTGTSKSLGAKDYTGYASKGVSFLLDAKIEKITKAINAYNTQIKVLTDISANQELIAKTEEHTNILRELRAKAKRMEDNEVDFQTRMSQWGVNIDKKLKEKKHDGAIPGEGAEITDLFIKIRVCKAKLKLVDLSSGMETAGIHNTMNNLTASTSALLAKIDGRQDGRTSFSRIESNRWASASSAIDSVNAVMASKSTHIGELETEFLSTFTKRGGAANSGTQIPSQY